MSVTYAIARGSGQVKSSPSSWEMTLTFDWWSRSKRLKDSAHGHATFALLSQLLLRDDPTNKSGVQCATIDSQAATASRSWRLLKGSRIFTWADYRLTLTVVIFLLDSDMTEGRQWMIMIFLLDVHRECTSGATCTHCVYPTLKVWRPDVAVQVHINNNRCIRSN